MSVWPSVKLGDVVRHVPRPVDVQFDSMYREMGIRSHGKGVFHKAPISGTELGDKRVFFVEPGDFVLNIVFAWEGAVGLVSEAERGMIASHRFPTFRSDEQRLDLRFLLLFFRTPTGVELLGRVSPGGAGRNRTLNRSAFLSLEIPLPPLPEQQRLLAQIDELAGLTAKARSLCDESRAEADALNGAESLRLFSSSPLRVPLEAVGDVRGGIQKSPDRHPLGNPARYLTVAHVQRNRILIDDPRYFEVSPDELERWRLESGDVLIIEGNGSADQIGRAALFRGEIADCVHQNHVIRIRPKKKVVAPEFLNSYLNSPAGRAAVQAQARSTSGLRTLSVGRIRAIEVPALSLAEQHRIVAELDALQSELDALKAAQAASRAELDALLPAVLDRAFAGAL